MGDENDSRTAVILFNIQLPALRALAETTNIRVVGAAGEPQAALRLVSQHRPGMFITEIDNAGGPISLEVVRAARRIDRELKVIVLSNKRDRGSIVEAFGAGADIYVCRDADPADVASSMRQLFNQSFFIAADWALPGAPLANGGSPSLTRREFEILKLAAEGHTNGIMASMLFVTEQTIKFHLSNIYRKLNVTNRTEASRWAQLHGLLPLREVAGEAVASEGRA